MKYLFILVTFFGLSSSVHGQLMQQQSKTSQYDFFNISDEEVLTEEESKRGFTFAIDLGMYLASKKTANIYNGSGGAQVNEQALWYSVGTRFGDNVGLNNVSNITQEINDQYPEYNGTVTGYLISSGDLPLDMNYSPRIYFGLNATYHLSDYWGIVLKSSVANLKSTAVYTMELIGPSIPQNASEVIQQFDITGEEQRLHFDFGFRNTSYNDFGFKWFWGGGISAVGSKILKNTAFIGEQGHELILQNNGNTQFLNTYNASQTAFNIGFYATTGWEMEYKERYDFALGFNLSRDPIELGLQTTDVWNKRVYISFGI